MRVLVACEQSGVVRRAFRERGHDAWSCDLLPSEDGSPFHLQCDARLVISPQKAWDLLIAHPVCRYLTNAGAKHLYIGGRKENGRDEQRWLDMEEGAEFYKIFLTANAKRICIENPVMHMYARVLLGRPTQYIHPWQFGHAETKRTGLRLINLPNLEPTDIIPPDFGRWPPGKGNGYEPKVHFASPGPNRERDRSRTLTGIAAAMEARWGCL